MKFTRYAAALTRQKQAFSHLAGTPFRASKIMSGIVAKRRSRSFSAAVAINETFSPYLRLIGRGKDMLLAVKRKVRS
jgi:hypothetical protein